MMISQMRTLVALCIILVATTACAHPAPPSGSGIQRRGSNDVPKISDTLAVAKSPFEPVTLASSLGNLNSPEANIKDLEAQLPQETTVEIRRTTRATQEDADQDQKQAGSEQPSLAESATIQPAEADVTSAADAEIESTTTSKSVEVQSAEKTSPAAPATTTASPPSSSQPQQENATESSSGDSADQGSSGQDSNSDGAPITTAAPNELNQTPESVSPASISSEISEKPATTSTTTTTTEAPETEAPLTSAPAREAAESSPATTPATTTTTTTTAATEAPESPGEPDTEPPAVVAPVSSTTTTTTTTEQPPAPSTTSTTTTSTTAAAPELDPAANKTKNSLEESNQEAAAAKSAQACNHLPTYETDEIQKVFREETTYKNGTIKGKFTYINFDQRYRLVHYTRLPYGPVKIDLVEELGKPENNNNQAQNQSQPTSLSDIPNAVLQLRNILPNSLFGFPFLGPQTQNSAQNFRQPQGSAGGEVDDKSNTYFYSTDTISAPNQPSTGASQQPRQPAPSSLQQPVPAVAELGPRNSVGGGNHPYEPVAGAARQNSDDVLAALYKHRQQERANADAMASLFGVPNNQQFQYAVSPQGVNSPDPKQPGLIYPYLAQPQYQYSPPAPLYSFQQPHAYFAAGLTSQPPQAPSSYSINVKHDQHQLMGAHQTHQPHSHEHFTAPFMFAQPPTVSGEQQQQQQQVEPAKIKLKVKTSKSLNVGQSESTSPSSGQKSAQLRAAPQGGSGGLYSAPANSPVTVGRRQHHVGHRHRSGKQNQDLKQTVNTAPVVYHVLRSPMNRMYNLHTPPQYNRQSHAIAYDHDN